MELSFESEEVREICDTRAIATKKLGALATSALLRSLADIEAAESIGDLRMVLGEGISHPTHDVCRVSLASGWSFLFRAGGAKPPRKSTGATDWDRVSRIRIMAFEQNNG